jgi:plasmid stability protein
MRTQRVPGQPLVNVTFRLPEEQIRRLKVRAARRPEYFADLLRRYIDAGDAADTQKEDQE